MGWHESQQRVREEKKINNKTYIILHEQAVRSRMVDFSIFEAQLSSARNELNIPEEVLK